MLHQRLEFGQPLSPDSSVHNPMITAQRHSHHVAALESKIGKKKYRSNELINDVKMAGALNSQNGQDPMKKQNQDNALPLV